MKNIIRLIMVLCVISFTSTSCKSKQKIAEISGANIPATGKSTVTPTSTIPVGTTTINEQEITRNENFSLAEGETNSAALNFKYHVVVGSFKSQTNAKGLQTTLNNEGNSSIIVINEQSMFRVLIASFNEYSQAKARINQIKERFPDAWVLVKK